MYRKGVFSMNSLRRFTLYLGKIAFAQEPVGGRNGVIPIIHYNLEWSL
jgi:hypothetical protein